MAILVQSNKKPSVSYPEQTGSIVTFNSQYAGLPLKSCKVNIPVTQEGTGDPSPDNVRNFVGVDSLDFSATGKNLFSYDLTIRDGYWANGFVGTNAIVPKESAVTWQYIRVYVEGLSSITLSGFDNQSGTNCAWLSSENPNDIISEFNSSNKNGIKTVPSGTKYLCLVIYSIKNNSTTHPNAQLEIGNTATAFEPFGSFTTINLGGTYYGGEYDARTGVLTVTHGVVDLGARAWYRNNDGYFFCEGMPIIKTGYANHTPAPMMCENLKTVAFYISSKGGYFEDQDKAIAYGYKAGDRIYAHNTDYTNVSDFTNSMNGIKLVYELATPEVINLGGMEISTLQGENNLFASTGETTAQYIKIG